MSFEDKIKLKDKTGEIINPAEADKFTREFDYDANGNPIYIGESHGASKSEAKWRIKKLVWDANGNLIDILWGRTDNKILFDKVWDERTSYSYS